MLYHDMTNDYTSRGYRITITLQEGYYKGEIYYDYNWSGAAGHGLAFDVIERIYNYLLNLEYIDDDNWVYLEPNNGGSFELENNCGFKIDRDNMHLHFVLVDNSGNTLEKTISKFEIGRYIVGICMSKCVGLGVKRDSRKCGICKNFNRIDNTASGICLAKNRKVSQGTTICKFDFCEVKKSGMEK